MQLDLSVQDGFRTVARDIGNMFYNSPGFRGDTRPGYHNHFQDNVLNSKLPTYEITDDEFICFCGTHAAQIIFSDIRYAKILKIELGDSVIFNEHDTDVIVQNYYNDSTEPMDESFTHGESDKTTHSMNIMAELVSQFSTKVAGGNPGTFQAEAEAQLTAKFGFSLSDSHEVVKDSTRKIDVHVPPFVHAVYSEKHSIADISEKVTVTCLLDAGVTVYSEGDYKMFFESIHNLELYMQGGGGGINEPIDDYFQSRVYAGRELDLKPLYLTLSDDRISRNTKTSELRRHDENIVH